MMTPLLTFPSRKTSALMHQQFKPLYCFVLFLSLAAIGCRQQDAQVAEPQPAAEQPQTQTADDAPSVPRNIHAEISAGQWTEVDATSEIDSQIETLIDPYRQKLQAVMQEEIAVADAALVRQRPESPLGGLVADTILRHARQEIDEDADCALMNRGGIRLPELPAGPITVADIYQLVPFDNLVVVVTLTGQQLETLVQTLAADGGEVYSGIVYELENKSDDSQKNQWMATNIRVQDRALDPDANYKVATVDYLANIGGEFAVLQEASHRQDGTLFLRDAMIQDLRQRKTIKPVIDGRVTYANATND